MTSTRDTIRATEIGHHYEMVESGEQSEYSHLQHTHGGSLRVKFGANSTGTAIAPSASHQNRNKLFATKSLSLTRQYQPKPLFDSPEYMAIEMNGSDSIKPYPQTGEGFDDDTEYSRINHEMLTSTREVEGNDLNSEGYHQLPSVFIEAAKQQPGGLISTSDRPSTSLTNTHPLVNRHKSANSESDPYTPIKSTEAAKRNTYSFSIVSTDEQYVSERGHVYHLLERSHEHRQNRRSPSSTDGGPKFSIREDDSTNDRKNSDSIPPYSQVNKPKKKEALDEWKGTEQSDQSGSNSPNSDASSRKVIPVYSQVDKSKKKNRRPQLKLDEESPHLGTKQ